MPTLAPTLTEARRAVSDAPSDPAPLFQLCCLLLEQQDRAANELLPSLDGFPAFAPGWLALGRTLLPLQPAAALIAFTRALISPSVPAFAGQAAALTALGRHREAAATYAQAEPLAPTDARLPHERGLAFRRAGDLPAARDAVTQATRLDPNSSQFWQSLGILHQDQGEHAAAAKAFRAALAARPDFPEAAFNLGVALQEDGALEPALDAYAIAWRLRPASIGRIAQALVSPRIGRLWLNPTHLRRELASRL